MVRNGHSVILFPNWLLSNWYEMVMVQNTYGTKWFLAMVRNCNFVVRNKDRRDLLLVYQNRDK
jgi:hypothetical protein